MLGDLYEITDRQTLYGQEVLNVYQYRQIVNFVTTEDNIATVLKNNWSSQILPSIVAVQAGDLTHNNITVKNLFNSDDYVSEDINVPGTYQAASAPSLPSFDAYSFTARGTGLTVKPGGKRLAGVTQVVQTDGVITSSDFLALLATTAAKMKTSVTVGTVIMDATFQPVLVKRIRSGTAGNYVYRMPANQGELVYANIVNTLLKILISSQVSRKVGVGA